ncbi:MAG: rhodanese [Desulfomonile tiedjei]|nr:rhodanese [Desulfomonile tiedjei]
MLSPLAARKAEKLGYKNVKVFHAGLPAWKKAGNIVISNVAGLENYDKLGASYILIDLRPAKVAEKGHIPKAVAMPEGGLDALKDQFPKYLNAPVILYAQHGDTEPAKEAYKKVASWGYKQVSILTGGFDAWEKAGKTVAKGPADAKITYVRKLLPGEVDVEVFKTLVEKPAADTVILDVRAVSEIAEGVLPNAKTIPLDDLATKLADLPKDKKIVIHCSTGVRAEMAYNQLKEAGFNAEYVKANVDFDKEKKGAYKISD